MAESDDTGGAYRVLARKYRPGHFDDLIGQDAMVRVLRNAFAHDRIAHAFVLTGVRGVGKTTTARIIAKGLNCTGRGDRPTIDPCGVCAACRAIAAGRHVDVIEMDAASNTGVNDVREIIEAVRYRAVEARYKVYIVDEVHMLSTNAFNALLKTLEEPPDHVVFVFATTEIRKVPVTVLSRCQRFDLRRIEPERLLDHLRTIAGREGVSITDEALGLIVRAAEGSVRDALSLLDQAIAVGGSGGGAGNEAGAGSDAGIGADAVRAMLGLADAGRLYDLFEAVMAGQAARALAELRAQYADGADPLGLLRDLATLTHDVSVAKIAPEAEDPTVPPAERARCLDLAGRLPMRALSRSWQMLLKMLEEAERAPSALMAAEMAVIRLTHVAELPAPAEVVRRLTGQGAPPSPPGGGAPVTSTSGGGAAVASTPVGNGPAGRAPTAATAARSVDPAPAAMPSTSASAAPDRGAPGRGSGHGAARAEARRSSTSAGAGGAVATLERPEAVAGARPDPVPADPPASVPEETVSLETIEARLAEAGELLLVNQLAHYVRPVRLRPGVMEIALADGAPRDLAGRLSAALGAIGPRRWSVVVSDRDGGATLGETRRAAARDLEARAEAHPLVAAALAAFPGARIAAVRPLAGPAPAGPTPAASDETKPGALLDDEDLNPFEED